jgi:hypothetical protein
LQRSDELNQRNFYCVRAFFALGYLELNFVVLADFAALKVSYVYENVVASFVVFDETKAFGFIEEFYRSGRHGGGGCGVSLNGFATVAGCLDCVKDRQNFHMAKSMCFFLARPTFALSPIPLVYV